MDLANDFCPDCSQNVNPMQLNFEKMCPLCGFVFEKTDFASENTKIIEEKGCFKRVFHPNQAYFYDPEKNEMKRKKKLNEALTLCSSYLNLTNEEKEDIRKKVEYYLDQTKNKASDNLKSLTAAMVYLKALSEKKHFSLKKFLTEIDVKYKRLAKCAQKLKVFYPLSSQNASFSITSKPDDGLNFQNKADQQEFDKLNKFEQFQKIFDNVFEAFKKLVFDYRQGILKNLFKPVSTITHNNNLLEKNKQCSEVDDDDLFLKMEEKIRDKAWDIYTIPKIYALNNDRNTKSMITSIFVIIMTYFKFPFSKKQLSEIFEVSYSILIKMVRDIENLLANSDTETSKTVDSNSNYNEAEGVDESDRRIKLFLAIRNLPPSNINNKYLIID